ncbi:MAG TPA: hypothetical protein VFF06_12025, partial [Polyangia bacterium]|nr:hypothetical protein [Polyangia bacterium]
MARVRKPGAPLGDGLPPPTRGPEGTQLAALLSARRFRLGAGAERVAKNLLAHGGEIAADAAAWIGAVRPPPDAPSLSLGEHAGTLGPSSFGFLNNVGGVAALDAPLPALPRRGGLALLVPRRDALPDVVPLALARGLGVSWIISTGDGDPAEALAFLAADPLTSSIAIKLGASASGATLRQVLGAKPSVVWGGDSLCRAVARRAGALVVDGVDEWLARAALYHAGVEPGGAVEVLVLGGGRAFVDAEVRAAALDAEVRAVDERAPDELTAALARAREAARAVVLVAGGPPILPTENHAGDGPRLLPADLRHPEQLRALLRALALPPPAADDKPKRVTVDKERLAWVHEHAESDLNDHLAKALLKAYGVRVSKQGARSTPTAAAEFAKEKIGLPVVIACGAVERTASTVPDVKRIASLLLQDAGENPSVIVREFFPEVPRARARVTHEKTLGFALRVGEACALLPLTRADALELAAATAARRAADQR